jgi:outer membrane protein
MKSKLSTLLLFLAITVASAQGKKWSLQECVEYAVENNLTVAQFELDLESATLDKSDAIGALLPSFNGNAGIQERSGLVVNPNSNTNTTGTIFQFAPGMSSNVTLFDGLRNIHRLNRAKLTAIANQYRLDDLKDDIRLSVAQGYLRILSNKEALKVSRAQFAVTEQDLKRITELVDSGVVPRGELLDIQATSASQEQQIVNGESLVLISKISLAQLLQINDYENFDILDETFEIPPSDILNNSPKTIFAKALEFRNDIKLSKANVELAEKDLQIAKGALYPTLNTFFNYNTFYTDQFRIGLDPVTNMPFSFRDDFKTQLYSNDGISYGFQLNVPVFNGFSVKNNIKRSKIDVNRSELQLEQDKLELEATVQQSYVDVITFSKAYEAAEKTLEARRLAYQYAKERFDVGLLNSFDFSQAQARVDNAEADVIRTKYDYIFRLKILEFYFGMTITLN